MPALYDLGGQFRYMGGFNPAGLVAWAVAGGIAAWYSQYAVLIGFPLGLAIHYAAMKAVVLPAHPQAGIEAGYPDDYLATSVGRSWDHRGQGRFARVGLGESASRSQGREDL